MLTNSIKIGGISDNSLKKVSKRHHHQQIQKDYVKRMWQSFRRQISTIRGIICELAPLVKHAYPTLGLGPSARPILASSRPFYPTSFFHRPLSTSSVESIEIDASPVAANSTQTFRLVTGCYGLSKEIFYGKSIQSFDKNKTTYGDDSW